MENQETNLVPDVNEIIEKTLEPTPEPPPPSTEGLIKMAEMKHKAYLSLIGVHIDNLNQAMLTTKKSPYPKRVEAATALTEAVLYALDFGLDKRQATLRQEGTIFAKESHTLAAILAQMIDNKMLLMALKLKDKETENESEETPSTEG